MTGRVAITGAGSDIGRTCARRFIAAGWRVALIGRHEETLCKTADDAPALVLVADVGAPDTVACAFARIGAK